MALTCPEEYKELVNTKTWHSINLDRCQESDVNGYILYNIAFYDIRGYHDTELWEVFKEDFDGWTIEIWDKANTKIRRDFRNFLRHNGVFVNKNGKSIAIAIQEVLDDKQEPKWTEKDIEAQLKISKKFCSRWNPNYQRETLDLAYNENVTPQDSKSQISKERDQTSKFDHNPTTRKPLLPLQQLLPPPCEARPFSFADGPSPAADTSRKLANLTKLVTEEMKFGGEIYDIFNTKLRIFDDCCRKIDLPLAQYHEAFSIMLKGKASTFYYDRIAGRNFDIQTMMNLTREHFETEENRQFYVTEWRETTLRRIIDKNPTFSRLECLEILFNKLQLIQRGLAETYQQDVSLRDQVIAACRDIPECELCLFKPAPTYEGVCNDLRSSIGTKIRTQEALQMTNYPDTKNTFLNQSHFEDNIEQSNQHWTDRTYNSRNRGNNAAYNRGTFQHRGVHREDAQVGYSGKPFRGGGNNASDRQKKCFICGKSGCWSTKHSEEDKSRAFSRWKQSAQSRGFNASKPRFQSFLTRYEGIHGLSDDEEESDIIQLMAELEFEDEPTGQFYTSEVYFTREFSKINGAETVAVLNDQSTDHALTKSDIFTEINPEETSAFTFDDRYGQNIFQGIMPDTGAAGVSTAGESQVKALQKIRPDIQIDHSTSGMHRIRFGKGSATSLGTVNVTTQVGPIRFHVVPANTPFLLCIADMDKLGVKLDNLRNVLVQGSNMIPIVRKWGHPWLLLNQPEKTVACSHLTESELRRLHRRFGHPSAKRLIRLLHRSGHEFQSRAVHLLTKYCHQCQMNQKSPGRFKFTLKDDYNFNYAIIVDVMYLNSKPILHVVDEATSFQAARFLKDMTAKTTWNTLRQCWIDTYLGPPDYIVHDAGKNFASDDFRQQAKSMAIEIEQVPVEAHNAVGKVERYHTPLRRAYDIISSEITNASPESVLQMAIKAVNDTAGPDGIIPTLLVFGAYPRMTYESPPSPSITQRAEAIRKAMNEVRHLHAKRQVSDALGMRNGPNTLETIKLPLQADVRVYREKEGWTGPYKLIATDEQTCTVQMPYGPTSFRSTVVKPYYKEVGIENNDPLNEVAPKTNTDESQRNQNSPREMPLRRHLRDRPTQTTTGTYSGYTEADQEEQFLASILNEDHLTMTLMTAKEKSDCELSIILRRQGRITTPGAPFEASDKEEIDALIGREVIQFVKFQPEKHANIRIFNSRMVHEIKGKSGINPYEKSRLVIQGHSDHDKDFILTQSPTIQRASQRLIIALAPSLFEKGLKMELRDITQAYTQSSTVLKRLILARLPKEIQNLHPPGTIMVVLKPLYGIAEAGTHWWATYFTHHKEHLLMNTSTYDPCLLISTVKDAFGIVGMQTDDTLILCDENFSTIEEKELVKAKLIAKPKEKLGLENPLSFNGCILLMENNSIYLKQKGQGNKIDIIDIAEPQPKYREQRARAAYLASICQPEASFDLSTAAQNQEPNDQDILALNKRLSWHITNLERGLRYVPIDLNTAKLFVFVDGSFANNKDLSSQLGYEIIIANERTNKHEFCIHGNLIHWSSTKSKRVTRSVLASEIYGMVNGVDMAIAISTTLKMITNQLQYNEIPTIVCTDSYSLYECLVKLGTTKEKRLMIDIMALRQSYERRELFEIRWINGNDNPADSMTKAVPNKALETFVNTNSINVRMEGWVKR